MKKNNSKFQEEAKLVAPLVNILGGPILNLIKRQIKNWMLGNEEKRTEAWKYFSDTWKRIPIQFRGKPYSFFIRIRNVGSHSLLEIATSPEHAIYRGQYDVPVMDKLKDNDYFYSELRSGIREFRRGLAKALKDGHTRKYKKMKKERLHKENSLPKKTKTVAAVETEEASVGHLIGIVAGALLVKAFKSIINARRNKNAKRIRAWRYLRADRWLEIPVKHDGKKQSYFARTDVKKNKGVLILSTSTSLRNAISVKHPLPDELFYKGTVRGHEDIVAMEKVFYRHLAQASDKLKKAIKNKRKSYTGEDRKKFDAQINGRRADMNTPAIATVTDRLNAIALYLDPEQLKWQCADFGHVSVDDYGSDEQTIIITRHRQAGNVPGFIYVTTEKDGRKATFKATNSKFAAECDGVVINTIDDMSEKLRAFEHMITSLGRHLQNYVAGMPDNPSPADMKEYKEANRRKIPEVQKFSTSRGTAALIVTSPFLPDTSLQIFNASPKALEKAASSMSLF